MALGGEKASLEKLFQQAIRVELGFRDCPHVIVRLPMASRYPLNGKKDGFVPRDSYGKTGIRRNFDGYRHGETLL
jgi:hypothetical protein